METREDIVLMSGWVYVSEEATRGKNQKKERFWIKVKNYYDEIRAENPEGVGIRNENQMKSRYARLNEAANKWVVAYREAYRQKRSGMSMKDVEKEAHAIFELGGSKFNDLVVFNDVMCKHPKWDLHLAHNTTRSRPEYEVDDEESCGSTKRSRTSEEGDYSVETNKESPNSGVLKVQRPMGRDATKKKRKRFTWQCLLIIVLSAFTQVHMAMSLNYCDVFFPQVHMAIFLDYCVLSLSLRFTWQYLFHMAMSPDYYSDDEYDEWQSRVVYQNQQLDYIINDIVINSSNLFIGDQPPRATRRHRDRQLNVVTDNDEYFAQRHDATGRQGLSPLQKCTAAMRVLAYGASADAVDEYLRMGASTTREALMHFIDGVISCFSNEYLRKLNETDLARLLYVGDQCGFPCSLNDINVLHRSPIFDDVLAGRSPKVSYVVNGYEYDRAYYLTDGIYPSWAAFVKSITSPQLQKHKLFAQVQESCRKDVERAFGVLQARFAFIRRPCLV
ncbi:hypothetical protein OSB04_010896 [Centaurea solstitialis]|uniref:Uncharacterized protein n=1 Tax=Centaurea solstitialis TaxID=347529 RepID=A0AA38WCE5_9ASTR|nr:hypothetical protein OSB04_010896 [Centaurea solstitialis]